MAEPLTLRAAPVFPEREMAAPGARVWAIEGCAFAALAARRGRPGELRAAVLSAFDVELPTGASQAQAGGVAFVGTGPGAWLAVAPDPALIERLTQAAADLAAVVDQSGGYGLLGLEGPGVRDLLARLIALDLDPLAFPETAAAVCAFGHLGAILWRSSGLDSFRLALQRTTAADAWRSLSHAADALTACA